MQPLDPSVLDYLADLTDRGRAVLGEGLVGVYAAGSIALDAYQPGRSDIDIAVVTGSSLDLATKQAIVAALRHESLPCPARGLELVVYRAEVAAAATSDPGFEVELNTGPRMAFRVTYAGADRRSEDGTFWYAIDRSILAERGLAVTGPPAAEVFRSVPEAELVTLLIASLRWHLGSDADADVNLEADVEEGTHAAVGDGVGDPEESAAWTDDAVLNACRAWRRIRTGHWSGKVAAGRQLLAEAESKASSAGPEVPGLDRVVIEQALAARGGGPAPGVRQARWFQRQVLGGLQAVADNRVSDGTT